MIMILTRCQGEQKVKRMYTIIKCCCKTSEQGTGRMFKKGYIKVN